ncbi:MAG TPA: PEP-CTERM sorting domain-containing protein [Myxococcota bacterium]|nr:PEP-CTERM sorting domain-containing protein [Myxococcota bacterium]
MIRCKRSQTQEFAKSILAGGLVFLAAGMAQALTYRSGDLVGVFSASGTELIVDMGPLANLTNGEQFTFGAPSNFGPTGAIGGQFTAFSTQAPFSGFVGRDVTFSTAPSINPPSFDNPPASNHISDYVLKLAPAQVALDKGNAGGWLQNLNTAPPAGTGGIIINDATRLAFSSGQPSSYLNVIGLGQNRINNQLPFSTAANLSNPTQELDLWTAVQTAATTSKTTLLGTLEVQGNPLGDGSEVEVTFSAVPEPSTFLLVSVGLSALAGVAGRAFNKQR